LVEVVVVQLARAGVDPRMADSVLCHVSAEKFAHDVKASSSFRGWKPRLRFVADLLDGTYQNDQDS
jgi:hypothetical protein